MAEYPENPYAELQMRREEAIRRLRHDANHYSPTGASMDITAAEQTLDALYDYFRLRQALGKMGNVGRSN